MKAAWLALILGLICSGQVTAQPSPEVLAVARQILEPGKPAAEREKLIAQFTGDSGALLTALTTGLRAGQAQEYERIPSLWQVAMASARRDNLADLKSVLEAALPEPNQPLPDWRAVVLGGGVVNGLSQSGFWPGERVAEMLKGDKHLRVRWERACDLAVGLLDNEAAPKGTRYDALRILGADTFTRRSMVLKRYLAKGVDEELQQGAVSALSDLIAKGADNMLVSAYPHLIDKNRKLALDGLLREEPKVVVLLDAMEKGKIVPAELGIVRIMKLKSWANPAIRAQANDLIPENHQGEIGADYFAGAASVDITPNYSVYLSGYGSRTKESEGIDQHLFAKALAIGSDTEGPSILLTVDNVGAPAYLRNEIAARLARRSGIKNDRFTLCWTHTHTAPMLKGNLPGLFHKEITGKEMAHINRYTTELMDKLEQVAITALNNRRTAKLSWGRTKADFATNRRTKDGPVDQDLPILKVSDKSGQTIAILFNYACHCTCLGGKDNHICGDWAGYAQEYLERDHPGTVALAMIGCAGDANPAPHAGSGLAYAKFHGQAIATAVNEMFFLPMQPLRGQLGCHWKALALSLQKIPAREDFFKRVSDPVWGFHAWQNIRRINRGEVLPREIPYAVQTWNFGRELAIVFLTGEATVDYSLRLKKEFEDKRLWVTAYANAVPCYIPSKRVLREGGYEAETNMTYYDWPAKLDEGTEDRIIDSVHEIMPEGYAKNLTPP